MFADNWLVDITPHDAPAVMGLQAQLYLKLGFELKTVTDMFKVWFCHTYIKAEF
jgi:hypothetical protein